MSQRHAEIVGAGFAGTGFRTFASVLDSGGLIKAVYAAVGVEPTYV